MGIVAEVVHRGGRLRVAVWLSGGWLGYRGIGGGICYCGCSSVQIALALRGISGGQSVLEENDSSLSYFCSGCTRDF